MDLATLGFLSGTGGLPNQSSFYGGIGLNYTQLLSMLLMLTRQWALLSPSPLPHPPVTLEIRFSPDTTIALPSTLSLHLCFPVSSKSCCPQAAHSLPSSFGVPFTLVTSSLSLPPLNHSATFFTSHLTPIVHNPLSLGPCSPFSPPPFPLRVLSSIGGLMAKIKHPHF